MEAVCQQEGSVSFILSQKYIHELFPMAEWDNYDNIIYKLYILTYTVEWMKYF